MKKPWIVLLTGCIFGLGTASGALLKNVTTDTVVCDDNFESATNVSSGVWSSGDTQDADPDAPNMGTWAINEDYPNVWQVTSHDTPVAGERKNYLRVHRVNNWSTAIITGVRQTTGTVHMEMMTYVNAKQASGSIYLVDTANGKLISSLAFNYSGNLYYYYGGDWHNTGIQYTIKQWKKLEVDWVIGASTYDVTYDGQTTNNIPVRDSATGVNGIQLAGSSNSECYFDAVPEPIKGEPILKNITTDTVVVHDDFESTIDVSTNAWFSGDPQQADPDRAVIGKWNVTAATNNVQVTSYGTPGACEGNNYLREHRDSGIYPSAVLTGVRQTNGTVRMSIMTYMDDPNAASILMVDGGTLIASLVFGRYDGIINYYSGGDYHKTDISYVMDTWEKLEIEWEIGSETYGFTYNGQTTNNIPVRTSASGVTGIQLSCSSNTQCFFDAVPPPSFKGTIIIVR